MFSYASLEKRAPLDHPLLADRRLGRSSIAPDYILRALLLQAFYSVRSERMLVAQDRLQPGPQ
jgi:hypothetical protein